VQCNGWKSDFENILPTAPEPENNKKKIFEGASDAEAARAAADSLAEERKAGNLIAEPEASSPTDRGYRWEGGQGKPVEPEYTVDPRRAAEDISRVRALEHQQIDNPQATAAAIDAARADVLQAQQPAAEQPQTQPEPVQQQPTGEQQQAQSQEDEIRRVLEQNPVVRQALEVELKTVSDSRAQYEAGLQAAAKIAGANLYASFPELVNVPSEQLNTVISAIGQSNPQRAEAMRSHLQQTATLMSAMQQAEQQRTETRQQNFNAWRKAESARFDQMMQARGESPESVKKIAEALPEIIEKDYGISREELAYVLQTNPALHSANFQLALLDAAKYRLAQREVVNKIDRTAPPVQRPGTSQPRTNDADVGSALNAIRSNPSVENAVRLLQARRASNSRR
jgi:hypothetical protein